MTMTCREARTTFSLYMDGALKGSSMRSLEAHLSGCAPCSTEYRGMLATQQLVAGLGRKQAPPEMALRIRIALSQQKSVSFKRRAQGILVRLENAFNAIMIPATGGLVSAVLVFGAVIGCFAVPTISEANDVPTLLYTPPRLVSSPFSDSLGPNMDSPVVIEAYVDANGRVGDYRVIAGQDNDATRRALDEALIFTTFEPAKAFGERSPGTAIISFANVSVKG